MPRLVVISGPSGVGKTTVCSRLLEHDAFARVITATTRPPRPGERDGTDYHFLTLERFARWVAEDRFLEWAEVHGRRYGSPRAATEAILAAGRHALLNIDVQGAASIRAGTLPALTVFLLPPSVEELERRLRGRASDDEETIRRRLAEAQIELDRQDEFDWKVVNDDSLRAAREIAAAVERLESDQ